MSPSTEPRTNATSKIANSRDRTHLHIDESLLSSLNDFQSLDPNYSTATASSRVDEECDRDKVPGSIGVPDSFCNVQEAQFSSAPGIGVESPQKSSVLGVEGKLSLRCKLNVNSLTVTFNKQEHPLARGSVGGVTAEVRLAQGNMEISGALGQGSVVDMTETGAYYRER